MFIKYSTENQGTKNPLMVLFDIWKQGTVLSKQGLLISGRFGGDAKLSFLPQMGHFCQIKNPRLNLISQYSQKVKQ